MKVNPACANKDTHHYSRYFNRRWDNSNKQASERNGPAFSANELQRRMSGKGPALNMPVSANDQGVKASGRRDLPRKRNQLLLRACSPKEAIECWKSQKLGRWTVSNLLNSLTAVVALLRPLFLASFNVHKFAIFCPLSMLDN